VASGQTNAQGSAASSLRGLRFGLVRDPRRTRRRRHAGRRWSRSGTGGPYPYRGRQDGRWPRTSHERYRVREVCRAAKARREGGAQRRGRSEAPRVTLRQAVSTAAAGDASEQEFFDRLADSGVLIRKQFSTRRPSEVTGYAVALPGDTTQDDGPVWFSGGKLAADLTLPRLRGRWEPARATPPPAHQFTTRERNAIWPAGLSCPAALGSAADTSTGSLAADPSP
jgi:hypothetical protein